MEIVNVVNISQLLTQSETVHLFAFAKHLYSLVCNEPNSVQQYPFFSLTVDRSHIKQNLFLLVKLFIIHQEVFVIRLLGMLDYVAAANQ